MSELDSNEKEFIEVICKFFDDQIFDYKIDGPIVIFGRYDLKKLAEVINEKHQDLIPDWYD